jgi:hypothetical protein
MTNQIVLIENQSYQQTTTGEQHHIETALKRVVGSRLERTQTIAKAMDMAKRKDCVFAVPVKVPHHFPDIEKTRAEILKRLPSPCLFAVCFLILPTDGFSDTTLLEPHWTETIDTFYDQAIPVQFVALHGASHAIQLFHTNSAIASLFRDIDNLKEMHRIERTLSNLEERIQNIENP